MLKVQLHSFGYHKSGLPIDKTPNKGGFVFDCRYIDNPRWIPELQPLCGADKPVIDFLDNIKPMQDLLENVKKILKGAVANYIGRDFESLMISFGCTGGQHRSVYAAEKIYEFLKKEFNNQIRVSISHAEYPNLSRDNLPCF